MTHKELRKKFIQFFTASPRNHKEIPSSSLVPENDPTSLFTSSGMQPLITYLLGEKHPLGTRLVNSQKCFRSQDIEEIGDNRHTTFFEMLGNWSLGDYFKDEQLRWNFEFLTRELGLDPKRLYVTVFDGDKKFKVFKNGVYQPLTPDVESISIWKEIFSSAGIDAKEGERIFAYPAKKNWWSRSGEPEDMPPEEPGGPDSEVFFDFGEKLKLHEKSPYKNQECHPNCDCGRFLEIANSVFMQYQKQAGETFKELPNKNVDFGGGLERMLAASNNNPDIFQTDLFSNIIKTIEEYSEKKYSDEQNQPTMRVVADHLKAATFIIVDGVTPSNKTQGYVLRRLLRRSAVKMHQLKAGVSLVASFQAICKSVLKAYEDTQYFNFNIDSQLLDKVIDEEMSRFSTSLDRGLKEFKKASDGQLTALFAFNLYQTYGFPYEITEELFKQKNIVLDKQEFNNIFKAHQELSRTATKGIFKGGLQDHCQTTTQLHTATHLLQQALRLVLGDHVRQKGSHITAERLRFDFSHPEKLTDEQIKKVEDLVNQKIKENLKVSMQILSFDDAVKQKVLFVAGAKYPEKVKVYSIGSFSKEVCGGPHVDFTGRLGKFKIVKEEALGTGIRRIYAILKNDVTS